VNEGDRAPDFELQDQDGRTVRLGDQGDRTVVLYFYPEADTPGCTAQACGVRDRQADYEAAGAVVLGISPDTPAELRRFADKHGLAFTLLADPDHQVAERYGTWVEKTRNGQTSMGVRRSTFLIRTDGTIARVFPTVSPKTHDDVVLAALEELRAAA
jgi:thioredoxin-dependent peroxiredoxin